MSGYIGNVPVPQATQTRETFTATASQTSFATAGYNPGYIDVFLNGVKLVDGTDYTATNGSDVVLSTGAAASDILEVVAYSTFEVANQAFTGDFSVDSPTFVVDSTNNRVGIGTASPATNLEIRNASAPATLKIVQSGAGQFTITTQSGLTSLSAPDTGASLAFGTGTGGAERARIDASGNLLVGLTATEAVGTNAGTQLRADGLVYAAATSDAHILSRRSTDGAILNFRKDTTTVGSIGAKSGNPYLSNSTNGGIYLGNEFGRVLLEPCNESGTPEDNLHFIGSSTNRWRDLYLSGGVYLGGTGAANYLDDYEEGTWTPGVYYLGNGVSATMTNAEGAYTKIGRLVNVVGMFVISSTNSGSGAALLNNLPFTVADVVANTSVEASGVVSYFASLGTNVNTITLAAIAGSVRAELYNGTTASSAVASTVSTFNANAQIRFSLTYYTT